jgi:glycosyltransferase involved in cell wall biosynthesis
MMPLISVVMPVYNGEQFFGSAIESILEQSHENLELIVVDDSLHDKCREIAKGYLDPRVRYLKGLGEGLVSALNFGVSQAKGKYIARMDADDISFPNRLALQLKFLQETGCKICGSWMRLFGTVNHIARYPAANKDIMYYMLVTSPFAHPTILAESEILKNNPYFEEAAEDYGLWVRLAQQNILMGNVTLPLLKYRVHAMQISSNKVERIITDSQLIAKQFAKIYLPKRQFLDLEVLGFGRREHYSKIETIQLTELLFQIAKDKNINRVCFRTLIPIYWRKTDPMNPWVFWNYLRMVRKYGMAFWSLETFNICIQSLLFAKMNGQLFGVIKKFGRS